jgi:transcriptional regulator with XRE-family HTH domain
MEAHPVDIHVGKKLRSRRTILGKSQEEIGSAVGITFQQIQKYERGLNRVGSSRLYEFACLLGVGVAYFFEGFENDAKGSEKNVSAFAENTFPFEHEELDNKEVLAVVRAYFGISNPQVRKKMVSLMKSMSDTKDIDDEAVVATAADVKKKMVDA